MASTELVNRLKLPIIEHPKPYTLQWLRKENKVIVSKQAFVAFSIAKCKDEVGCDVLPMDVCHLLYGRPWQYDRDIAHHGKSNIYSFKLKGKKMTLTPSAPHQAHNTKTGREKHKESALGEEWRGLFSRGNLYLLFL